MKPVTFECQKLIPTSPANIAANILDMSKWPEFTGYGMLPGIKEACYEVKTDEIVGSRIRVTNTDGSNHIEEIYHWVPNKEIGMKLQAFSAPLNKIALHFDEFWRFYPADNGTLVSRSFQLVPKSIYTKPMLWLISLFFRRAIDWHLEQMAKG